MTNLPAIPESKTPLRLIYGAGPGDVIGTYRHWREGRDDPGQVSVTYSGQFYSLVRELGATAMVISSSNRVERVEENEFVIENRPVPHRGEGGIKFHLGQYQWAWRFVRDARRFKADAAVIDMTMCAMPPLRLLPMFGIKLILSGHVVLWPKMRKPAGKRWKLMRLNAGVISKAATAMLSITSELDRQIEELTRGRPGKIIPFVPTYRAGAFEMIDPPPPSPFRVMFAGRIVRDKGVFDIVEIARRFKDEGQTDIHFDIAGDGADLELLKQKIRGAGVESTVHCHGYCKKDQMRALFRASHVGLVPTRTDFVEGIAKTVVEGVMSGRPVITSTLCGGAVDHVGGAVVLVPPDDPKGYGDAILRLRDDAVLYESKRAACGPSVEKFYDASKGWAMAVRKALGLEGMAASQFMPDSTRGNGDV